MFQLILTVFASYDHIFLHNFLATRWWSDYYQRCPSDLWNIKKQSSKMQNFMKKSFALLISFFFFINKPQANGLFSFPSKASVVFMVYRIGTIAWSQVVSQLIKVISLYRINCIIRQSPQNIFPPRVKYTIMFFIWRIYLSLFILKPEEGLVKKCTRMQMAQKFQVREWRVINVIIWTSNIHNWRALRFGQLWIWALVVSVKSFFMRTLRPYRPYAYV